MFNKSMLKRMQADRRLHNAERRAWSLVYGYGPRLWADEGRLRESGEMLGYRYGICGNGMGFLCGYLEVPYNHPWARNRRARERAESRIETHGGVTFVGMSEKKHGKRRPWWFGFDCGHAGDAADREHMDEEGRRADDCLRAAGLGGFFPESDDGYFKVTIKREPYVREVLQKMAEQARRAAHV